MTKWEFRILVYRMRSRSRSPIYFEPLEHIFDNIIQTPMTTLSPPQHFYSTKVSNANLKMFLKFVDHNELIDEITKRRQKMELDGILTDDSR